MSDFLLSQSGVAFKESAVVVDDVILSGRVGLLVYQGELVAAEAEGKGRRVGEEGRREGT